MSSLLDPRFAPPDGALLDWDHPLATGLVCALLPRVDGYMIDWFNLKRSSTLATYSGGNKYGPALGGWTIPNAQITDLFFTSGPFTVLWIGNVPAVPSSNAEIGIWDNRYFTSSGNNGGWGLVLSFPTNAYSFEVWNNSTPYQAEGGTVSAGDHQIMGTSDGGNIYLTVDGVQPGGSPHLGSKTPRATTAVQQGGTHASSKPLANMCCAWNRQLTPSEITQLAFEPFPFFRMPVYRTLVALGAFGPISANPAALLPAM